MNRFQLDGRPFVALHNLLKLEGWCPSGAAAKHTIDAGLVRVDGEVELRKRCKIKSGQVVEFDEMSIEVVE
jgi:ribosome-associated protein